MFELTFLTTILIGANIIFVLIILALLHLNIRQAKRATEKTKKIHRLAYYDTLTGLPNRLHFQEKAEEILNKGNNFAYFLIDLDNFKKINDTLGHHAGDETLEEIAKRLESIVQLRCEQEDDCRCFVSRLGGDEFVMILENIDDTSQARDVADKIIEKFEIPIEIDNHILHVSASVGISLYPIDGMDMSTLLKAADLALYSAKDKGKNRYLFHEISMNRKLEENVDYEKAIRYFIDTEDFDLSFQPLFDIHTGKILGIETLFRGNRRRFPTLDPAKLIQVAEESGLIVQLGFTILDVACELGDILVEQGFDNISLSVNISIKQLEYNKFCDTVLAILKNRHFPPENLILEITETVFMEHFEENVKKLTTLGNNNIGISIDDFGTGFSSMSYLRDLPVDKLKIDKSFVDDVATDQRSAEIVKAIILMAITTGLKTCAEGVETEEQYEVLKEFGCNEVQGYLCGSPSSIGELLLKLGKNKDTCKGVK